MRNILVLGAGRSSSVLIRYLLGKAAELSWTVTVADISQASAIERIENHPYGKAIAFDINNRENSAAAIEASDVVISLLPPPLHPRVASICLEKRKHLLTASYVSDQMKAFHERARSLNLLFLNECGLDPGIDHMSAMQIIDQLREEGAAVTSFESFTGGLIAPETDPDNPWRYKFTWNPKNVVTAGQATASFREAGVEKYIPYQQLFRRVTPVHVPGLGDLEGYANRDSLRYMSTYGLENTATMIRGTLRFKGYCEAWNLLVQLGCCDDTYEMHAVKTMTHAGFISAFLPGAGSSNVKSRLQRFFNLAIQDESLSRLEWSGFFNNEPVGLNSGTPAAILEHILSKKWALQPRDKDLVVMWHRFAYAKGESNGFIEATLYVKGEDAVNTAMAQTVGLPLGIAARVLLEGKILSRGVAVPTTPEFYVPVLAELVEHGITLIEKRS